MDVSLRAAHLWLWCFLFVAVLALQACGGGGGGDTPPPAPPPPPPVVAPSALSYSSPQTYTVGVAITPLAPTVTGTATSYAVAPALPAGLSIDATTGQISGTPTATATSSAYTVTAANAGGSTTFELTLAVEVPLAAPSALTYSSPQEYRPGVAIAPLVPTVTGTVASYAVAPALPAGLGIDATTGEITGTPTTAAAAADYTITASNAAGSATFALSIAVLYERATADRPDEKTGRQVHVMYVLPQGGADQKLDTTGKIEGSVRAWNKWFVGQTGKEIRVDTYGSGLLDVTFLQLPRDDAYMNIVGGNVRRKIEFNLFAKSFDSVDKIYLVYYGGSGDGCGRGAWPPTLHGTVAALYIADPDCPALALAGENDPPGFWDFLAPHEILHVLGLAPATALHHSGEGHVSDSPLDLMYSGGAQPWAPSTLDVNDDDYFACVGAVCANDGANSAFLEPLPASPAAPPGWPYVNLVNEGCANEATVPLAPTALDTQISFVNDYAPAGVSSNVIISELVLNGAGARVRAQRSNLPYLEGTVLTPNATFGVKEGAVYVASVGTFNGACIAVVRATAAPSRFAVRP